MNLFAVSNSSGNVTGTGVTSSTHTAGSGRYNVIFNQDVTSCAKVASVGDTGAIGAAPSEVIRTGGVAGNVNGVAVQIVTGRNGTAVDDSFHLIVVC